MKIFFFKSIFGLIALVVVLLSSGNTQNALAQFGLFDTVWTMNGLPQNYGVTVAPNDSLFLLWTYEKDTIPAYYFSRYRLFNTISKELIWDTIGIGFGSMLKDNKILSWDSNKVTIRDLFSLEPISTATFKRPNFSTCQILWGGVSEVDTSVYYSGYCGATAIKGISYKVNYRTGQATITTDSLPYFAMTISEDGQYVAGVYYTGGDAINVPYNEVIEVRKISDYSVVFRESKYYSDYDPNFYPYNWVSHYEFKFSKDNKYLALHMGGTRYNVFNLLTGNLIFESNNSSTFCDFSKDNKLVFIRNISYNNVEERYICIYNCEKNLYKELSFPDSNKVLSFNLENLLIDDKYLFVKYLDLLKFKKFDTSLGEIALLKINFDLTSVFEPENPIQGTLYPNPTNLNLNLKLKLQSPIALNSTLHNDEGRLIKDFGMKQCEEGENIFNYNVSEQHSGIYFLKLSGKNFSQTYKVIINR